jgi:serine/threonine protein kinase
MSNRAEEKTRDDNESGIPAWANVNFSEIDIGDRIGGGGVGIIYKGWWGDRPVALKTLFDARISGDLKKEYMDELLVMSRVNHSNIVEFLGACMTPPNLCFIMELCESSLFNILHVDRIKLSYVEKYQAAVCCLVRWGIYYCI